MFRIDAGKCPDYCDGISRRNFLQVGMAGMGSLSIANILRAKDAAVRAGGPKKDTSCILIWLDGGPSQHDTYDPKPEAPAEYRGIWQPIETNVPGMLVTELFPKQAKIADKFSIIRSMHHPESDHFAGAHWMLTGHGGPSGGDTNARFPCFAAIATAQLGPRTSGMPPYVGVPIASSVGKAPGYFSGNYIGTQYDPLQTGGKPEEPNFKVQNLNLAKGLTIDRLQDRRSLLTHLDRMRREVDSSGAFDAMDSFDREAYELVAGSTAVKAFDIASESEATRERYGMTHWGQSTLLARRLVEAGSTFVTVTLAGWDSHWNHQARMDDYLPKLDHLVPALLNDLEERGILDKTLVMVFGEFGRTPKMNDGGNGGPPRSKGTPGRDHWGNAMSVLIAGGGVKGGRIVGATNSRGEEPKERPLSPGDLHHTVFHVLGANPDIHYPDTNQRPIRAIDHGDVIRELF